MKKKMISTLILLGMMIQMFASVGVSAATDYNGYYNSAQNAYVINRISASEDVIEIDLDEERIILGAVDSFGCILDGDKYTELIMPNTVVKIGNLAFENCSQLNKVTLSDSLESIGYGAFAGTGLTSVQLPSSLKMIDECAFRDTDLTEITVPGNVSNLVDGRAASERFAGGTFADCKKLKTAVLETGVQSVGDYTFYNCISLQNVSLPSTLRVIGKYAFENCSLLTGISLPASLTTMKEYAFKDCTSLNAVTIPSNVSSYTAPAFYGCTSLEAIEVAENNVNFKSVDGVLFTEDLLTLVEYPAAGESRYTVPMGTVSIGANAFNGNDTLESIVIPSSVTEIGADAFADCSALETVYFGGSTTQWNLLSARFDDDVEVVFLTEPQFTSQPTKVTVNYGTDAKIEVNAKGTDLSHQWYRVNGDERIKLANNVQYQGTTSKAMVIDGEYNVCDISGQEKYVCVISNIFGEVATGNITLYVSHVVAGGYDSNDNEHWGECYCGETFGYAGHSGSWKVTKEPTYTSSGKESMLCDTCGHLMKTRSIAKLKNTAQVFSDIRAKDWYYKNGAIDYVYNAGLFGGTSTTTFEPNTNMTRGMFVTVLGRLHGVSSKGQNTKFTDVKKSAYYSGYVKWASDNGIVTGTSSGTFSPEANVTREQICAIMVRYCNFADITLSKKNAKINFEDASSISSYAKSAVTACQRGGVVGGESTSTGYRFRPQGNATRAEVATIMMNFSKNYLK